MSRGRHSYIKFYPTDWMAGTARLTRLQRSVYFEICLYNWDKGTPMPRAEQQLAFADLPEAKAIIETLLQLDKIHRTKGGSLASDRAVIEARSSRDRWEIAHSSGKRGAEKRWGNRDLDSHPNGVPIGVPVANQNQNQNQSNKKKEKEPIGSKKNEGQLPLPIKAKVARQWREGEPVPDEWVNWAVANMNWSKRDALAQGQRMIDYALAHGRSYTDWLAAWRNWCRNNIQKIEPAKAKTFLGAG
jgi:hypothetical protein